MKKHKTSVIIILIFVICVESAQGALCFARFNRSSGVCDEELGDLDEDDCCLNPHYGYITDKGDCQSCGPPTWSDWSPWSSCSNLCGPGVTQRRRRCLGIGQSQCEGKPSDTLQAKPCNGTCCNEGWSLWQAWSPCSVTCGGTGVRKRERLCSVPPECIAACVGATTIELLCDAPAKCPVHGGWSLWSSWSVCSSMCVSEDGPPPYKRRRRSCSDPAPSADTVPPGNACQGDDEQQQSCIDIPKCPVDGNWGDWSPPGACSAQCGEGVQLSTRECNQPAPKYGGRHCVGSNTRTFTCHIICPADGSWSDWSHWSECSSTCIPEGGSSVRTRRRACTSPSRSLFPEGKDCSGHNTLTENCVGLPPCTGAGSWGSWAAFSACPVTCGVGLEVSLRNCEGSSPCSGENRRTRLCNTGVHCPVDGVWSEWSPWQKCTYPFGGRDIRCKQIGGGQSRERRCLHRAHGGAICGGDDVSLSQYRGCYDVNSCYIKGNWTDWEPWSLCKKACGGDSVSIRRRKCSPDYSEYRPTIGRLGKPAFFYGDPLLDCGVEPGGGIKETQPCVNVPACD
ncbi:properdin-like isoform X1 [Corythoichthys intestinalis]|uniref:properdin-like isoform X1 n=1 Tax=Corythoichthys intestinalis TaxID=161448 RepID=UPI0025A4DDBE|nr:properdin-like isoform X1 [Corythoichthys intestinalis]